MTSIITWRDGDFRKDFASKKLHLSNIARTQQMTTEVLSETPLRLGADLQAQINNRASRYVQFDSFHELLPEAVNRITPSKNATLWACRARNSVMLSMSTSSEAPRIPENNMRVSLS